MVEAEMGFLARALIRATSSSSGLLLNKSLQSSSFSYSWIAPALPDNKDIFIVPRTSPCRIWISKFCTEPTSIVPDSPEENAGRQRQSYIKMLTLEEVEKVLKDVRAQDVKTINVQDHCEWTNYMVFATGKSTWHIRNIAQALVYKVKQKQKGAEQLVLPGVEGREGGKWLVIDSGSIIIHALDENARAYYNLESLWTDERPPKVPNQDLENSLKKIRRRRNSTKASA